MPSKQVLAVAVGSTLAAGFGLYYVYRHSKSEKKKTEKLEQLIGILDQKYCHLKDVASLRGKLRNFISNGGHSIQMICDFDRTLTKAFVNGQPAHVSYGVIERSSFLPESSVKELGDLYNKFHAIEMSPTISEAEKTPLMIEWFSSAFEIIVNSGIKKQMLPAMVRESTIALRDGCDQFFHVITENKIPIFILSAGIGDVIEEILKQQSQTPPQSKIVANFNSYDSDGTINGRKGEMIHTFNKNDASKENTAYFNRIKKCTNVVLLGDTLGDLNMADGVDYMTDIIKIGFLNDKVEESMDAYLAVYDIVLTDDASMDVITLLLDIMSKG